MKVQYTFGVSLILHLIILLPVLLGPILVIIKPWVLSNKTQFMPAYLYEEFHIVHPQAATILPNKVQKKTETTKKITKHQSTIDSAMVKQTKKHSSIRSMSHTSMNKLLILLHTAIRKAQYYPNSALEMERTGRATVIFTLYTNGTISNLSLLHSSGTISLDDAALEAVKAAAPFEGVEQYLSAPQQFHIDIIFE